jgi:hypothetical protein
MAGVEIERAGDANATGILTACCVICTPRRAAGAMNFWRPEWPDVALNDAELRRVVQASDSLAEAIRRAVLTPVESQK